MNYEDYVGDAWALIAARAGKGYSPESMAVLRHTFYCGAYSVHKLYTELAATGVAVEVSKAFDGVSAELASHIDAWEKTKGPDGNA